MHKTQKKCGRLQKAFSESDVSTLLDSKDDLQKYTEKSVDLYRQNKKLQEQQKRKAKRAQECVEQKVNAGRDPIQKVQQAPSNDSVHEITIM